LAAACRHKPWYDELFTGEHEQALKDAREATALEPEMIWLRTNEAHALLLLDREAEAMAIYQSYQDAALPDGRRFSEAVVQDFAALRKAGVKHPGMARVEALYGAPAAEREGTTIPKATQP
jgi:predicted Zn-dependent protease